MQLLDALEEAQMARDAYVEDLELELAWRDVATCGVPEDNGVGGDEFVLVWFNDGATTNQPLVAFRRDGQWWTTHPTKPRRLLHVTHWKRISLPG